MYGNYKTFENNNYTESHTKDALNLLKGELKPKKKKETKERKNIKLGLGYCVNNVIGEIFFQKINNNNKKYIKINKLDHDFSFEAVYEKGEDMQGRRRIKGIKAHDKNTWGKKIYKNKDTINIRDEKYIIQIEGGIVLLYKPENQYTYQLYFDGSIYHILPKIDAKDIVETVKIEKDSKSNINSTEIHKKLAPYYKHFSYTKITEGNKIKKEILKYMNQKSIDTTFLRFERKYNTKKQGKKGYHIIKIAKIKGELHAIDSTFLNNKYTNSLTQKTLAYLETKANTTNNSAPLGDYLNAIQQKLGVEYVIYSSQGFNSTIKI